MKFIFDLDGTVTATETLPVVAAHFGVMDDIGALTAQTIAGHIPFVESFMRRVEILGRFSASETSAVIAEIALLPKIADFIAQHQDECVIATGNLDVWTAGLARRFGCDFRSARALVKDDRVEKIDQHLKKELIVKEFQNIGHHVIYIGDGHNDAEAMRQADVAIAVGIVHEPARSVMEISDFAVCSELELVGLLDQIKVAAVPDKGDFAALSGDGVGLP